MFLFWFPGPQHCSFCVILQVYLAFLLPNTSSYSKYSAQQMAQVTLSIFISSTMYHTLEVILHRFETVTSQMGHNLLFRFVCCSQSIIPARTNTGIITTQIKEKNTPANQNNTYLAMLYNNTPFFWKITHWIFILVIFTSQVPFNSSDTKIRRWLPVIHYVSIKLSIWKSCINYWTGYILALPKPDQCTVTRIRSVQFIAQWILIWFFKQDINRL